jgi:hypothetical protein
MPATDLRLVVDIAAWWISAVSESGGTAHPVFFDGRARAPSGVFHHSGGYTAGTGALVEGLEHPEAYRPDPMTLLRHGGPAAAVAAVLTHVAEHAGQPSALTVLTAQTWEPPARERLDQAAALAGLPRPAVITTAAAAAALTGADLVLVCVAGAAWPELTLVDTRDGHRHLATATVRANGAPAIDEALMRVVAARGGADADPDDWRVSREIERARTDLVIQRRAAMLLPDPHQAVALTRDDLEAATAVHLDRLADTVKQLLADAGTDPGSVGAVVLVGESAQISAALTEIGFPPAVTVRSPHVLVRGTVAHARQPARPSGRFAWPPWRRH